MAMRNFSISHSYSDLLMFLRSFKERCHLLCFCADMVICSCLKSVRIIVESVYFVLMFISPFVLCSVNSGGRGRKNVFARILKVCVLSRCLVCLIWCFLIMGKGCGIIPVFCALAKCKSINKECAHCIYCAELNSALLVYFQIRGKHTSLHVAHWRCAIACILDAGWYNICVLCRSLLYSADALCKFGGNQTNSAWCASAMCKSVRNKWEWEMSMWACRCGV